MIILLSTRAEADLEAIGRYIAQDSVQSARETVAHIHRALLPIAAFPHLGRRGSVAGTLELVVRHRFIIVYCIDAKQDCIQVIAVAHHARDH